MSGAEVVSIKTTGATTAMGGVHKKAKYEIFRVKIIPVFGYESKVGRNLGCKIESDAPLFIFKFI